MIRPFTAVDIIFGKKYYEVNFLLSGNSSVSVSNTVFLILYIIQ